MTSAPLSAPLGSASEGTLDGESQSLKFSRTCRICCTASPHRRAIFPSCGHVVCRACAEQLAVDAMLAEKEEDEDENEQVRCPFCRVAGAARELDEERSFEDNDSCRMLMARLSLIRRVGLAYYKEAVAVKTTYDKSYEAATAAVNKAQNALFEAFSNESDAQNRLEYVDNLPACSKSAIRAAKAGIKEAAVRIHIAESNLDSAECALQSLAATYEHTMQQWATLQRSFIACLRQENEESATIEPNFSRACPSCDEENPRHRVYFAECRHVVCHSCAKIAFAADTWTKCPCCRSDGAFVPFHEELITEQ